MQKALAHALSNLRFKWKILPRRETLTLVTVVGHLDDKIRFPWTSSFEVNTWRSWPTFREIDTFILIGNRPSFFSFVKWTTELKVADQDYEIQQRQFQGSHSTSKSQRMVKSRGNIHYQVVHTEFPSWRLAKYVLLRFERTAMPSVTKRPSPRPARSQLSCISKMRSPFLSKLTSVTATKTLISALGYATLAWFKECSWWGSDQSFIENLSLSKNIRWISVMKMS